MGMAALDGSTQASPGGVEPAPSPAQMIAVYIAKFTRLQQHYLDKTTVWLRTRWAAVVILIALYCIRVYVKQGFYIVTYGLGIHLLNLLIGFLSPAVDPDIDEGALPTSDNEEFRPFSRRLPEFKFWLGAISATLVALVLSSFDCFDLPVFWPILLAYFILLVVLTMKDRIKHMIQHKYIPFSFGKQTYGELTKIKAPGAYTPAGGKLS